MSTTKKQKAVRAFSKKTHFDLGEIQFSGALGIYEIEQNVLFSRYLKSKSALETKIEAYRQIHMHPNLVKFINDVVEHFNNTEKVVDGYRIQIENYAKKRSFRVMVAEHGLHEVTDILLDMLIELDLQGVDVSKWERWYITGKKGAEHAEETT